MFQLRGPLKKKTGEYMKETEIRVTAMLCERAHEKSQERSYNFKKEQQVIYLQQNCRISPCIRSPNITLIIGLKECKIHPIKFGKLHI